MASSSGNSNSSISMSNNNLNGVGQYQSTEEEHMERKRKRMQSNRESARRSRMRKQQHLDDLTAQVAHLRRNNAHVAATIAAAARHLAGVEAENSVLRAQMAELTHRLNSLNDIVAFNNDGSNECERGFENNFVIDSLVRYNSQPIMANADNMDNVFLC